MFDKNQIKQGMLLLFICIFVISGFSTERQSWAAVQWPKLGQVMGEMPVSYGYNGYNDLDVKSYDAWTDNKAYMFLNLQQLFDKVTIQRKSSGFDENMGNSVGLGMYDLMSFNGVDVYVLPQKVQVSGARADYKKYIWVINDFHITMESRSGQPPSNADYLTAGELINMINGTLMYESFEGLAVLVDRYGDKTAPENGTDTGTETDEDVATPEESVPKTISVKLVVETNPATQAAFETVTAGASENASDNLQVELRLNDTDNLSVLVHPPEYGHFEGVSTGEKQAAAPSMKWSYSPPEYLKPGETALDVTFRVDIYDHDEIAGSVGKYIKVIRCPVVLVHGFTGYKSTWKLLDDKLQEMNFSTIREAYYFSDLDDESIPAQAKGLAKHIREYKAAQLAQGVKCAKVDVVAHSMGGLISRYLTTRLPNLYKNDVRKIIMVGTPNHGCTLTDRFFGWLGSNLADKHIKAGEQLYGQSPFILDLNKDEASGDHLNPSIQYGLLYGSGTMGGDAIVKVASAWLNGVSSVEYPGLTHSPVTAPLGPSLTEDPLVFAQILEWLSTEIYPGQMATLDMVVSSVSGEAYIGTGEDVEGSPILTRVEESTETKVRQYQPLITEEGQMSILLRVNGDHFGSVHLRPNTEAYIEYASPNNIQLFIASGSVRLTSRADANRHFQTQMAYGEGVQSVRSLQTDYVVDADRGEVYCLEGTLETTFASSMTDMYTAEVKTGQGVGYDEEMGMVQVDLPKEAWWYDSDPQKTSDTLRDVTLWNNYKQFIIGFASALAALVVYKLVRS